MQYHQNGRSTVGQENREQAISVVTRNLRIFTMERRPKDMGEMSVLAEQYLEVHGNTYNFANVEKHRHNLAGQLQSKYPDWSFVRSHRRTVRSKSYRGEGGHKV